MNHGGGGEFIVRALLCLSRPIEKEFAAHEARGTFTQRAEPEGRRASVPAAGRGSADRELATVRELPTARASAPVRAPSARLEGLDHVLRFVVEKCKGDCFTSKRVNAAVKNLKYTANSEAPRAEVVDLVLNRLIDGGLAEAGEQGAVRKGQPGRKCRWKEWAAIKGNPRSDALRAHLGQNDFP